MESNSYHYLFIAAFPLLLFVLTHYFLNRLQNQNLPPSPFPTLPLIGHLHLLKKNKGPFHVALSRVSRKYGPVLYLKFGHRPVLLISSPSTAEECFRHNDNVFANRPPLLVGKYLGSNFTSLVWSSYGQHWRNLRRIASLELLSTGTVQMLSDIRNQEVRTLISDLFQQVTDDEHGNSEELTVVDIRSALFQVAYNVMTRMIFGKRYYGKSEGNSVEAKMFREISAEILKQARKASVLDFLPFPWLFGYSNAEKSLIDLQKKKDKMMQTLIDEIRSMTSNDLSATDQAQGRKTSLIQVLLELQLTEPEAYPDEIIRGLLAVLYQASTDTSASTVEWAFSLLLSHQEIMKKAKDEIDSVVGLNRCMDESDLAQLPYLQSIIKETMRLHPAAPLLLPHYSSEDCSVAGYFIPRRTMLLVNAWAIQHDPKVWKEPEKFMPERFQVLERAKDDDFKLMPFGSGRRKCPGENLAIVSIGLALGSLLQSFEWERMNNQGIDMSEERGFLAQKVQPLMVTCYPRPHMISLLSQL